MAIKEIECPPGYKQTEVGVIPEDWEICELQDAVDFLDGQRKPVKSSDRANMQGIYPYYGASGIVDYVNGYLFDDELILLGEDGENILSRSLPLAFKVKGKIWVNNHAHVMKPKSSFHIDFLTSYLESIDYSQLNSGTAQPKLNKKSCLKINVRKPSHAEQAAIAKALSDTDAFIESLEQLIAKKRQVKQGAMQELLTGKRRLPGFEGEMEWNSVRLGEHVEFLRNGTNSRAELMDEGEGSVKYLHYGDIHACPGFSLSPNDLPALPVDKSKRLGRLRDGDLVFADASEDVEGIGKSVEIEGSDDIELVAGLHTIAARFDKAILADGFKAYLQCCPDFIGHLRRLAAGTKVFATNRGHIASAELLLPGVVEQKSIASVLKRMDEEITTLESKLTKARQLKLGMVRELLTGRIRLV